MGAGVSLSLLRKGLPDDSDGFPSVPVSIPSGSNPNASFNPLTRKNGSSGSNDDFDSFLSSDLLEADMAGVCPSRSKGEDRPSMIGSSLRGGLSLLCIPSKKKVFLSMYEVGDPEVADLQFSNLRGQPFLKRVLPSGFLRHFIKVLNGTGAGVVVSQAVCPDLVPTVFVEVWIGLVNGFVDAAIKDPTLSTCSLSSFMRSSASRSPDLDGVAVTDAANIANASRRGSTYAGAAVTGRQIPGFTGGFPSQASRIVTPDPGDRDGLSVGPHVGRDATPTVENFSVYTNQIPSYGSPDLLITGVEPGSPDQVMGRSIHRNRSATACFELILGCTVLGFGLVNGSDAIATIHIRESEVPWPNVGGKATPKAGVSGLLKLGAELHGLDPVEDTGKGVNGVRLFGSHKRDKTSAPEFSAANAGYAFVGPWVRYVGQLTEFRLEELSLVAQILCVRVYPWN